MSDARKDPVIGTPVNDSMQIHSHQSELEAVLMEELNEFIDSQDGTNFDTDRLDAILAALDEINPVEVPDAKESLAAFKEKYAPVIDSVATASSAATISTSSKKRPRISAFRYLPAAILIIVLLVGGTVTAQAFGFNDLLEAIHYWTSDFFQPGSAAEYHAAITHQPLEEGESASYDTLQDALDAFGITVPMAPQQIPERFTLAAVRATYLPTGIVIYADYTSEDGFLQVKYQEVASVAQKFESDSEHVSLRIYGGIEHHIMPDMDRYKAYWQNGELDCKISGTVSKEEMFQIVKSIYKGD